MSIIDMIPDTLSVAPYECPWCLAQMETASRYRTGMHHACRHCGRLWYLTRRGPRRTATLLQVLLAIVVFLLSMGFFITCMAAL